MNEVETQRIQGERVDPWPRPPAQSISPRTAGETGHLTANTTQLIPTYLYNHQDVSEIFGYWPGFHDSPVFNFRASGDAISFGLELWRITEEVDELGYFQLANHHIVEFEFHDIVATNLERFIPENILFGLGLSSDIDQQRQGFFTVTLDSAMGSDLSGEFRARSGGISSVWPARIKQPR